MIYGLVFGAAEKILESRRRRFLGASATAEMNIVDLGSGPRPYPLAKVCVDLLASNDIQRGGQGIALPKGMKIIDNDLNLFPYPFHDKEFDFIIASHLLEHLRDPVAACREISRIGKAGYVEMPALGSDIFMRRNDAIHKWLSLFDREEKRLFFIERTRFLSTVGFRNAPLWVRFLLFFQVNRMIWDGSLPAEYILSEHWSGERM